MPKTPTINWQPIHDLDHQSNSECPYCQAEAAATQGATPDDRDAVEQYAQGEIDFNEMVERLREEAVKEPLAMIRVLLASFHGDGITPELERQARTLLAGTSDSAIDTGDRQTQSE